MAEQTLEPMQMNELERHIDSCTQCRQVVAAALAKGSTPSTQPTAAIGSGATPDEGFESMVGVSISDCYVIKSLLGRGGMGAVYLARDHSLGRDVAIKLHRAGSDNDRLYREAIAMAKLAHPNVVTVFEAATFDGQLYVAMEYVRGTTLRGWLAARPRGWREIIELLLAAGSGLAAAHAAELVHRDFKPENVLVGEDGRPRVSDFGLARVDGRASGVIPLAGGSSPDTSMTVTGAVMGTPAYMAPEQLAGGAVEARSDQFAFCVVAWECLLGRRPFEGATLAALALAIERQELQRPPRTAGGVPQRVFDVIERGLAADPAARYSDMSALLARLRAVVTPRWRKRAVLSAAALVPAAAVAVAMAVTSSSADNPCRIGDDALAGAWDAQLREKVRTTFAGLKEGAQIFSRVDGMLDGYRRSWIAMRRASCEATRVRGEQSEALLDLRMACLDRKRDELKTVTNGLAGADRQVAMGAARAALGLSAIAECGDRLALSAPVRPPDQDVRVRIETERSALAEVRGLRLLGKLKLALEKAEAITSRAKELKYRPLEAEALLVLGDLNDRLGDTAAGIKLLEQAVVAADAGNHKLVAAEAWSNLAWLHGHQERQFERAQWAVQMAGAAIEGLGGNPELAAQLLNYEALILEVKGQLPAAKAKYMEALAARERIGGGESWKLSLVLNDLGGLERKLGNYQTSRAHHERALAIRTQVFGEHHPYTFSSLNNLGTVAWSEGDHARAEQYFRKALAVAEAVYAPQHPQTGLALMNLASALENQRQYPESIATYRRALAVYEATRGPTHPDVADTLHNMANVLAEVEQLDEARTAYARALAIFETKGDDDPELAGLLYDYGEVLVQVPDQRKQGEVMLQRSLALDTKADPNNPDLALALTALGEHYAASGRASEALPLLERALALRSKDEHLDEKARTELALAKVIWRTDRARARELATSARQHLEQAKATEDKLYRHVTQWLDSHR